METDAALPERPPCRMHAGRFALDQFSPLTSMPTPQYSHRKLLVYDQGAGVCHGARVCRGARLATDGNRKPRCLTGNPPTGDGMLPSEGPQAAAETQMEPWLLWRVSQELGPESGV